MARASPLPPKETRDSSEPRRAGPHCLPRTASGSWKPSGLTGPPGEEQVFLEIWRRRGWSPALLSLASQETPSAKAEPWPTLFFPPAPAGPDTPSRSTPAPAVPPTPPDSETMGKVRSLHRLRPTVAAAPRIARFSRDFLGRETPYWPGTSPIAQQAAPPAPGRTGLPGSLGRALAPASTTQVL